LPVVLSLRFDIGGNVERRIGFGIGLAALAASLGGCLPQTPGELGNGGFTYECSSTSLDLACKEQLLNDANVPEAVAVGASFGLQYSGTQPEDSAGREEPVQIVAAAPGRIAATGGTFHFEEPGFAAFLAQSSSGQVADFIHLRAAEVHLLALVDGLGNPVDDLELDASGAETLEVTPEDAQGTTLAGALEYAWQTSDDDVVDLSPGFDDNTVDVIPRKPGTATLTVTAGGASRSIQVTVGGTP
jgi:hypothetical protein